MRDEIFIVIIRNKMYKLYEIFDGILLGINIIEIIIIQKIQIINKYSIDGFEIDINLVDPPW